MNFQPSFLDEIRSRIGLVDFISRQVKLSKKGHEYSGLCPFHSEKTPSFTVNEAKGFFHCFGCGAHGDVIGFLMRLESLTFPESVERLAGEAGLTLPQSSPREVQIEKKKADLYQAMEIACNFFQRSLQNGVDSRAQQYLRSRNLTSESIERFRVGFAPDSRNHLRSALSDSLTSESVLIECGLLIKPENGGEPYDRFRNRVTFPIFDQRNRVIAFGARALGEAQPKYLNSPETPLFNKGNVLYGMSTVRSSAMKSGRVVVVEGYTDVIAMVTAGIEAVAPMGTALTENQLLLLWRLSPEPILCFDGDNAGLRAAQRAADRALPLLKPGKSLRFVCLPVGEDPDSMIRAAGPEAMEDILRNSVPLSQLIWNLETDGKSFDTPERLAGLEYQLERRAKAVDDAKVRYQYIQTFRSMIRQIGFSPRAKNFAQNAYKSYRAQTATRITPESPTKRREAMLLAVLIKSPDLLDEYAEEVGALEFQDTMLDEIRQTLMQIHTASPGLDTDAVLSHLSRGRASSQLEKIKFSLRLIQNSTWSEREGPSESNGPEKDKGLVLELIRGSRLVEAQQRYSRDPTDENLRSLQEFRRVALERYRENF
ncbi:MAG: DNA primase [Pseudomonadota bacterium]|nr:DNA primase [Pseudomonadota bacterium]